MEADRRLGEYGTHTEEGVRRFGLRYCAEATVRHLEMGIDNRMAGGNPKGRKESVDKMRYELNRMRGLLAAHPDYQK